MKERPQEVEATIAGMVQALHKVLLAFFGEPPSTFDWRFYDKDGDLIEHLDLTPHSFLALSEPLHKFHGKVSLVHDPRNPYDSLYTVSRLGNGVGGNDILYVNVPIDVLKKYTKDELTAGRAVWFGCEVGKEFCRKVGAMDGDTTDLKLLFDISATDQDKADRLRYVEETLKYSV